MEVKPGYKQTDVGVIPDDWEVKPADDLCRVNQGLQIPISNRLKTPSSKSRKYITIQYLNEAKELEYIDDYTSSVCCNENDVLMTRTGNTGIVVTGVEGVFHNNFFKINYDKKLLQKEYLVNYLSEERLQRLILEKAGTSTIPDLNHRDFYSIPIIVPPLPEQEAIAEALSDADALIESLEQLLTKKRQLKKGAMQELLTGKKRLPGFSGEWERTALGRTADIRNGATPSTQIAAFWNGSIPWCTPTDITGTPGKYLLTTERSITAEGLSSCPASLLPAGALLLCSRATIGEIKIAASPVCTNQGFKSLVCKNGVSNEFLYYLLLTLEPQMMERAIGSTFLEIGKRDLAAIEVRLPRYDEQTAIATILSDMDTEIAALEVKLSKARLLKQGMMQELLTGRIRLI